MKRIIIVLLTILVISCSQEKSPSSFTINGKIDGISAGLVYIKRPGNTDTASIKNGYFSFKGKMDEPGICKVRVEGVEEVKVFYLENSMITFNGSIDSLSKAIIKGSKTEDDRIIYNHILKKYDSLYNAIGNEYEIADENRKVELEKLYGEYEMRQVEAQKQFVRENPSSYLCINILWEVNWSFNSASELSGYLSLLDTSLHKYQGFIELKELMEKMDRVELGRIAPDFEMDDINGITIRLSDKYSNCDYLLLDFWASHCSPCRKENRHIRKAYGQFHDKGFDVLGVSTDTKKELWTKAIEKDGLIWTNVCSLKEWRENEIVKTYALRQTSQNFLLDNTGKIIAKDLRGEDLIIKLDELTEQ